MSCSAPDCEEIIPEVEWLLSHVNLDLEGEGADEWPSEIRKALRVIQHFPPEAPEVQAQGPILAQLASFGRQQAEEYERLLLLVAHGFVTSNLLGMSELC